MAVDYATLKKGGFMRQKQKNNFSLRLRTVGGHMSAEQLAKVAEVAEKYGEGYVHLTSRQGVEIPFIKLDQIEEVKNALAEGDVVPGVCGPRVRTVTACQGAAICQSGCIDTYALAKELDERYFGYELPHKFKFGITGCQNNCLKAEENDVGIKGGMQVAWVEDKCIQCGVCVKACRNEAITLEDGKISIDTDSMHSRSKTYKNTCNISPVPCCKPRPAPKHDKSHRQSVSQSLCFPYNQIHALFQADHQRSDSTMYIRHRSMSSSADLQTMPLTYVIRKCNRYHPPLSRMDHVH